MAVAFFKGHALGNDYLVLDARDLELDGARVRRLCDRHRGLGADGIVSLGEDRGGRVAAVVWNADGSTAEVSGNGLRIAAHHLRAQTGRDAYELVVRERPFAIRFAVDGRVEIDLPTARMGAVREPIAVGGRAVQVTEVDLGNPHAVVEASEVTATEWPALAAALERHPRWPARINVERLRPIGHGAIAIEIHERGVGPTDASGTGASAAAVAAIELGLTDTTVVRVEMAGGEVTVTVEPHRLILSGPVTGVASGQLHPALVDELTKSQ